MRRRDFLRNCVIASPAVFNLNKLLALPSRMEDDKEINAAGQTGRLLSDLQFRNSGIVDREMQFNYLDLPMAYGEGPEHWNLAPEVKYLFQTEGERRLDPPSGMRSAVPMGGLGSGTVELRADGSFRDWNIYNNSPAGGPKIQIDDTFFGIWTREKAGKPSAAVLRTHPPDGLPGVAQIEYSGAFPVSRLRFGMPNSPLNIELFAYSEFRQRDSDASATPAAIFTFLVHNPSQQDVDLSLLLNTRNYTGGNIETDRRVLFEKGGNQPTSGSISAKVHGEGLDVSAAAGMELGGLWNDFSATGKVKSLAGVPEVPRYGALAASTEIRSGETRAITFVLAWYLPYRPYKSQVPGNYYTKLFISADDVADRVLSRLGQTWSDINGWQQTIFNNTLPAWLQDALINSAATMYKTSLRFKDGTFMQWESFSCSGLNPLHIDFYRVLPYAFLFPDLEKQMLVEHAKSQQADGFIPEQLTTGCWGPESELGHPGGRVMGDSETCFLLWALASVCMDRRQAVSGFHLGQSKEGGSVADWAQ